MDPRVQANRDYRALLDTRVDAQDDVRDPIERLLLGSDREWALVYLARWLELLAIDAHQAKHDAAATIDPRLVPGYRPPRRLRLRVTVDPRARRWGYDRVVQIVAAGERRIADTDMEWIGFAALFLDDAGLAEVLSVPGTREEAMALAAKRRRRAEKRAEAERTVEARRRAEYRPIDAENIARLRR